MVKMSQAYHEAKEGKIGYSAQDTRHQQARAQNAKRMQEPGHLPQRHLILSAAGGWEMGFQAEENRMKRSLDVQQHVDGAEYLQGRQLLDEAFDPGPCLSMRHVGNGHHQGKKQGGQDQQIGVW